jgi:tetratricopeptide (TPR) repeat protein
LAAPGGLGYLLPPRFSTIGWQANARRRFPELPGEIPLQTPLVLRHVPKTDPPLFQVMESAGRATEPRPVPPADRFSVEGRPDSHLMRELRWYLEDFLGYPFSPETEHAERVLVALDAWGKTAFGALFGDRDGGAMLDRAIRNGHAAMRLQLWSDDPRVLSWPWEALDDPKYGPLGQLVQIERRMDQVGDPPALSEKLPKDGVNILLVTARPYESDVQYRSISRPLVELAHGGKLPANVHVLRPPTFDRLRDHLRERPGYYHILHFDGHGAYAASSGGGSARGGLAPAHAFAAEGRLFFETDDGKPAEITAEKLGPLLREYAVPVVVLNACQSAMLDEGAENAFASVAASLLRSGTRSVVAMAYSLYVSGAQEFLPAFYRRVFESGSVAEGARAGRQAMFLHQDRVCARGRFPLRDWLVPVLYQQEDVDLSFASAAAPAASTENDKIVELDGEASPYGFVGRDGAILLLERAVRRRPPAVLVHGLGGVGKTTLARGFVEWLRDTEGLGLGCLWFTFQEIRSAEYVLNRIGEVLMGPQFATLGREPKIEALSKALHENPLLVVWDNFEVVAGIPGTEVTPTLSAEDRGDLLALLKKLRGGRTKVLITSRSEEAWLGEERLRVPLGGLGGEERWEYCRRIVEDLGIAIDRNDRDLVKLMDLLGGHPLAMRVMLRELERRSAGELIQALQTNLGSLGDGGSAEQAKLYATLRFVEDALPEDLKPLLIPLSLHERFADINLLEVMTKQVDAAWTRPRINALFETLTVAGLLRDLGQAIYEMHPALTGFLRFAALKLPRETCDEWARAFVSLMAVLADELAPKEFHEQRAPIAIHHANLYMALAESQRMAMLSDQAALVQCIAAHALNTRNLLEARELFTTLSKLEQQRGEERSEAAAYHQLGRIAQERRDLAAAESWYRKSLDITEKIGYERGAAGTYNQLGRIADEQREFASAERWYRRSLDINKRLGNEHGAAITHHQLGMIAQQQRDYIAAEDCYRKSLEINKRLGNERGAAITYHQLGILAQEQGDFTAAERRYRKSLGIRKRLGDEHGAASSFQQLGRVSVEQRDLATAERWYRSALDIQERLGDEHGAALSYHQLGIIAQEQRDFVAAESWCRKSLEIEERLGDEHSAAFTYGQLGVLAGIQGHFEAAGLQLLRAIASFARQNDPARIRQCVSNFQIFAAQADEPCRANLRAMWSEAGLGELPLEV